MLAYSQPFRAALVPHQLRLSARLLLTHGYAAAAANHKSRSALAVALVVVSRRSLLSLYLPVNGLSIRPLDLRAEVTAERLIAELPDRNRPAPDSFAAARLAPPFDRGAHLLVSSNEEGRPVNAIASTLLGRPVVGPAFILPACMYEEN